MRKLMLFDSVLRTEEYKWKDKQTKVRRKRLNARNIDVTEHYECYEERNFHLNFSISKFPLCFESWKFSTFKTSLPSVE